MMRLNVISQDQRRNVDDLFRAHGLFLSFLLSVGICLVTIIALLIIRAYFDIRLTSVINELASTKVISPAGETLPVLELTKKMNAELGVLSAQSIDYQFDQVLVDLGSKTPDGIAYTSMTLSTKNGALSAQGFAASRNDVPTLEANLKQLPYLTAISIQSSLNERTHVPVTVTATIDRSKLVTP